MATISIDGSYKATITTNTDIQLEGGALYVGEWESGISLDFLEADGTTYTPYAQQSPGGEFRAPSTGKVRAVHTSDGDISLKKVPTS